MTLKRIAHLHQVILNYTKLTMETYMLILAFGKEITSVSQTFEWFSKFKSGISAKTLKIYGIMHQELNPRDRLWIFGIIYGKMCGKTVLINGVLENGFSTMTLTLL
jgi:hypothetical protein